MLFLTLLKLQLMSKAIIAWQMFFMSNLQICHFTHWRLIKLFNYYLILVSQLCLLFYLFMGCMFWLFFLNTLVQLLSLRRLLKFNRSLQILCLLHIKNWILKVFIQILLCILYIIIIIIIDDNVIVITLTTVIIISTIFKFLSRLYWTESIFCFNLW